MLILYKNVRNVRFVLFTKTLSAWTKCCGMDLITGFEFAAISLKVLSLIFMRNVVQRPPQLVGISVYRSVRSSSLFDKTEFERFQC